MLPEKRNVSIHNLDVEVETILVGGVKITRVCVGSLRLGSIREDEPGKRYEIITKSGMCRAFIGRGLIVVHRDLDSAISYMVKECVERIRSYAECLAPANIV